ncbi:hypothetical protein [Sphingomonas corticis]|jgi:hypothetical protein|uniref:Uncharacterized protein n=1 Tax=Sphingomonas corticis TaxID=2722791 RepID=A0ABX1CR83_9SPHN|nr:hypothetical protein [Sphingomonas corticis]NJR80458.1 hypothetical protein [Sphingomonas corticis]
MLLLAEGRRRAAEVSQQDRAWLAWHIAAFQRAKKMPRLSELSGKKKAAVKRRRGMSIDQLQTMAAMWAAATPKEGGDV